MSRMIQMPDLYLGIANQTANILSRETNEILPNIQSLTDFYRRLYNAVYCFFDKLSMRTKPSYDNFLDEEFENIIFTDP